MMNSNNLEYTKTLLDNLLFFAMHLPDARNNNEFKYVSSDWIGSPGWLFWPKARAGVYLLKLNAAIANGLAQSIGSHYTLYYYPSIDEPIFDNFSCSEQLVRVSNLFDQNGVDFSAECPHCEHSANSFKDLVSGKGIPTVDARQIISPELFIVGKIIIDWEQDDLRRIAANAPLRDQSWAKEAVDVETETGVLRLLETNALDRDVPCWKLTSDFTAALVHFLPVETVCCFHSAIEEHENNVSYGVRQTICRITGIIAE